MQSRGIFLQTMSESLVGKVDQGKQSLLLNDLSDLVPLFFGRVNAGRVVAASMQHHHITGASLGLQVFDQAIEVERRTVRGKVTIRLGGQASRLKDGAMVGPRRIGHEDSRRRNLACHKIRRHS